MTDFIVHLRQDEGDGTLCGEPWQEWQMKGPGDGGDRFYRMQKAGVVFVLRGSAPQPGEQIRPCRACVRRGRELHEPTP